MRPPTVWLLPLLLSACAGSPVQTARTVTGDPAAVAERAVAELTRLGFRHVTATKGVIEATAGSVAASWATCGPILVGDGDDRHTMVGAGQRRGSVRIVLAPTAGGTSVAIMTIFAADYRNPNTGTGLERACRTGGTLERMLLDAAAA